MDVPTFDDVRELEDEEVLKVEAALIEQSDNSPKPEDGFQPAQDEPSITDGLEVDD